VDRSPSPIFLRKGDPQVKKAKKAAPKKKKK